VAYWWTRTAAALIDLCSTPPSSSPLLLVVRVHISIFFVFCFLCTQCHLHPPHSSWWCVCISCVFFYIATFILPIPSGDACRYFVYSFPSPFSSISLFVLFHSSPPLFCPSFSLSSFFTFCPFSFYAAFSLFVLFHSTPPLFCPPFVSCAIYHTVICKLFLKGKSSPPRKTVFPFISLHPAYIYPPHFY
jgi:hypothetical protein